LKSNASQLSLKGFSTEDFELDGFYEMVELEDIHGKFEMDVRSNCLFKVHDLDGSLEINQMERSSSVEIAKGVSFKAINAGRKCEIKMLDGITSNDSSEDVIELNGMKSILSISTMMKD